jgi:hypothetical protein
MLYGYTCAADAARHHIYKVSLITPPVTPSMITTHQFSIVVAVASVLKIALVGRQVATKTLASAGAEEGRKDQGKGLQAGDGMGEEKQCG